ncbi:MAG TPA: POTRA domain-containing protein [Bryobacteraceae bacterium]|nr:POTRA domain-containing protein [Bryobacteraceae bacterium]
MHLQGVQDDAGFGRNVVSWTRVALPGVLLRPTLILLMAALPFHLPAATSDYEGKPVGEIRFVPEAQPLSRTELSRIVLLAPGQPLTLSAVRVAIQRLYASGRYDDVEVDAALRDGKVVLTFATIQNWFISRVYVEGVDEPPNREQVVGASKLELGAKYTEEGLAAAIQGIKDVLRSNGFYSPRIQPLVERYPKFDELHILFLIDAGSRAYFSRPVIAGNLRLSEESIINKTSWKRLWGLLGWKQITEARVQQGLERVRRTYLKQDFLLAKVDLKDLGFNLEENLVKPHLGIEAGPKVRVDLTGAKLSKGRLKELLPVYQEQSVDQDLLEEGARKLKQHFQTQGYFDTDVSYAVDKPSVDEETIGYEIDRGNRYKVVHVDISGNAFFDDLTVRERMSIIPAGRISARFGRFSEDMLARDKSVIAELYRSNGFRDVQVDARVERGYGGKQREVAVFIEIKEGPQWFVNSLEISGVDLQIYEYIRSILTSTEGQPYSTFNIATDRDNILSFYYDNGYPDAKMEVNATPPDADHRMDVKYVIEEGRRLYIQDVLINGLAYTRPSLVKSRIKLVPGSPLSLSRMVFSQRRLYDLGIFAKVDMAMQDPAGRTREKRVLYQFEEASRYSINGGVGVEFGRIGGSATNLSSAAGSSTFAPRVSLGVSRLNFRGYGHTIGLQTRLSTLQRRVLGTYLAPQFQDRENLSLTVTALYDDSHNVRTFSARRFESAVQLGQRYSRAFSAQYRLTFRRVSTSDIIIEPGLIPLFSQAVRVGLASTTLVYDHRDDPLNATRGIYSSIDISLANRAFGSQPSFGRVLGRNSSYHRLSRDFVLSRNTTFGYIGNYGSTDIPLPERFFAGGAVSHRAFPENQAGPRDLTTGFPLGGRALVFNQTELRVPFFSGHLGGVIFHDAGNVYSDLKAITYRFRQRNDADFDYMVHALGLGVRYRTPIGPVRLDFAYGINNPRFVGYRGSINDLINNLGERTLQRVSRFQFHFSLGQAF